MKKYIAKTNVSVNVVLASGKNLHISFSPLTSGGSVYYTELPEVQKALETHYKYGRLFRLDPAYVREKPRAGKPTKKAPEPKIKPEVIETGSDVPTEEQSECEASATDEEAEEIEEATEDTDEYTEGNVVVVNDPEEAKEYLCEKFGYSRTKIKGLKSIKAAAAQSGIIFKGLD